MVALDIVRLQSLSFSIIIIEWDVNGTTKIFLDQTDNNH